MLVEFMLGQIRDEAVCCFLCRKCLLPEWHAAAAWTAADMCCASEMTHH